MSSAVVATALGLLSLMGGVSPQKSPPPSRNTWSPGVTADSPSVEDCTESNDCHPGRRQMTTDNPATERGDRASTAERTLHDNVMLNFMECNDDLRWQPNADSSNPDTMAIRKNYFQKNPGEMNAAGSRCHCPRSGRWKGSWTNGVWFWDYDFMDWKVNTAEDVVVQGEKPLGATAVWEFWATGEPYSKNERFWVSTDLTVWGKPTLGAQYVPEDGSFQSRDKFVHMDADGNVLRNSDESLQYKSGHINVVYECQVLYTDTGVPDRRDGGCKPEDCGKQPEPPTSAARLQQVEDIGTLKEDNPGEYEGQFGGRSAVEEAENLSPAPAHSNTDHRYPHKMAWYMFMTASAGPDMGSSRPRGMPASAQGKMPKTCGDLGQAGKCDPPASGTVGTGECPNTENRRGPKCDTISSCPWREAPLCPNCVPTSNYQGADFQGTTGVLSKHEELGKAAASQVNREGLPACATGINANNVASFGNDYFSFCEYPMISSSMALPINGMYTNRSYTFFENGTISAGPPKDLMGSPDPGATPARAQAPGFPPPVAQDPHYDGIAGAANTLLLCDGVFDHCQVNGGNEGCAYGHDAEFLASLDNNKANTDPNNWPARLGRVPWLFSKDGSGAGGPTFASLVCVRNPWAAGGGYTGGNSGSSFVDVCSGTNEPAGASLFPPTAATAPSAAIKTSCLKGGGWGWPYCPAQAPTSILKGGDDENAGTTTFCSIKPQGDSYGAYFYFGCMSIRLYPILDNPWPEMEAGFWIVGATCFGGFAALWILFFVSIRKDEDEQDDPEGHLDNLANNFMQKTEKFAAKDVQKFKCGSCASPLSTNPLPLRCPFCEASRDGYLIYNPRVGQWVRFSQ